MVNNNNIPVDLPKTYTVSYFNETEWNKDLTPQEIAQQQEIANLQNQLGEFEKPFGPCYKSCNYANPDCECYISMSDGRYVPLYLVCPAPRYERPFCTRKEPGMWIHGICGGGRVYINTNLTIKCMKPGCGISFKATDASFACSTHESEHSKASKSEFGNALTGLNSLWKNKSPIIRAYVEKMIEKQLQEEGFYHE